MILQKIDVPVSLTLTLITHRSDRSQSDDDEFIACSFSKQCFQLSANDRSIVKIKEINLNTFITNKTAFVC